MDETRLTDLTVAQSARLIREKKLSPLELVEAYLARIDRLNPKLNAYLHVMRKSALADARQAEQAAQRGEFWGALHGVPIALKDLIDVAGEKTTAASDFLRDNVAVEDADVVRRLRAAGAILLGKTHLHEFAIGATNVNPHYGPARNPWNTDYSPGGSSGGSAAAVAAGMAPAALGTDTGGSVRVPAALCGLTGLRPGRGRLSGEGVVPMSWTLDGVGPIAHTAEDAALLLDALDTGAGGMARGVERLNEPVVGLRIGVPTDDFFWLENDMQVIAMVRAAIEQLNGIGMRKVDVSLPLAKEALRASQVISLGEAVAFHSERLESAPERFGEDVRARLEIGAKRSAADYGQARQFGRQWRRSLRALFHDQIDVLAMPTTPTTAPKIEGTESVSAGRILLKLTYPFSLSYLPGLSIPCGFTEEGFPVGLQLIAPQEAVTLAVGHAYQAVTDWHKRKPEL